MRKLALDVALNWKVLETDVKEIWRHLKSLEFMHHENFCKETNEEFKLNDPICVSYIMEILQEVELEEIIKKCVSKKQMKV